MNHFDAIVLGVGAMGSSACYALSRQGMKVLGLEQYSLGHDRGSSHGETRMIRMAYFEHPDYVPLLRRSYELWERIEKESGAKLFHRTGVLYLGSPTSKVLDGVKKSGALYHIPLEPWDSAPTGLQTAHCPSQLVFEPGAGYLDVEKSVLTLIQLARLHGAQIMADTGVLAWHYHASQFHVRTTQGDYTADRLVITAGAWSQAILKSLSLPLSVHRNSLFWFRSTWSDPKMPCFAFDLPEGFFYGFPPQKGRIKIACHTPGPLVPDPSTLNRETTKEDLVPVKAFVNKYLRGIDPSPLDSKSCFYTMTPDEDFIVDTHPNFPRLAFAAGFSGHGFKFAPVLGEALAELVFEKIPSVPLSFLGLRRFSHT